VALEDHGAVEAWALDVLAGGDDVALGRLVEARHDVEDGRLAAARVADDAGELALLDAEPQVLEDGELALPGGLRKAPGETLHAEERRRHRSILGRQQRQQVPSPLLVGEGQGGGSPKPGAERIPPPLAPPHKGEGNPHVPA
jgi:hypothetical protein